MRITVHEHPLPSDDIQRKTVLFEIDVPKAFAAYRDWTWKILHTLACPPQARKKAPGCEPEMHLYEYFGLKRKHVMSLASPTKSFLTAHYKELKFPVALDNVCVANGLHYKYYDHTTRIWPGQKAWDPTFAHHCGLNLPANSPFALLQRDRHFAVDANGPTSYEVVSMHTKCPAGLNVHEFMAFQALFSGKSRRWLSMLIELGSSSLNFSTEATMLLYRQLSLQAGPGLPGDHLRSVHVSFETKHSARG